MYEIDKDISAASTLPSDFYQDPETWDRVREAVFARHWLFLADQKQLFRGPENVQPLWLLENYLDEPILLIEDGDDLRCLSNVCTHRGFLLAQHPKKAGRLVCQYHGRRFGLDGSFQGMPEFEGAKEFPRPCDDLHRLPLENWRRFLFTSLDPSADFAPIQKALEDRLGFMQVDSLVYRPEFSKTYNVQAHWALYCDNYLEGFHIPFVHQDLGKIIDYGEYTTLCEDRVVLQIGYSDKGDFSFDLPPGHPDHGREVVAYYYWIFPNLMFNVYPWGIQVNVVRPVSPNFTKVEFFYLIGDEEIFQHMNGAMLAEKTEREDEFVVEAVQRGIRSRFYQRGRFSPVRESGVHHFHGLLAEALLE